MKANDRANSLLVSDIPKRLATICIGVPFVILCLSHTFSSKLFLTFVHGFCLLEWTSVLLPLSVRKYCGRSECFYTNSLFYVVSISCSFLNLIPFIPVLFLALLVILFMSIYTSYKTSRGSRSIYFTSLIIHDAFGVIFITAGFNSLIGIAKTGLGNGIYFALIVWNCDTGALIAGRLGKLFHLMYSPIPADIFSMLLPQSFSEMVHKLSPNKSITGFVGGIILGTVTAAYLPELIIFCLEHDAVLKYIRPQSEITTGFITYDRPLRLRLGFFLSICGIIGDLIESKVKRTAGQKDSGKLLPGHGGFMDRMDSMLLSAILYNFVINYEQLM